MTTTSSYRPLVTVLGSSGLIGTAVARALAQRPVRLRLVARRPAPVPAAAALLDVRAADLTDPADLRDTVDGSDAVIHLVKDARSWREAHDEQVNVGTLAAVLDRLGGRRGTGPPPVVLFAGSSSQVGIPLRLPVDGTEPDRPVTPYDRQKQAAQELVAAATADGAVRGATLRLPTVYGQDSAHGPADPGVLTTMVRRALRGDPLTVWHDGAVERDFLHVDDVATAFVAALDHATALAGRHWLVGTGHGVSLRGAFTLVADVVAAHTGRTPVGVRSVDPPDGATATDLSGMVVDPRAFHAVTGWRPHVALRDGLMRTATALAGSP